MYAGQEEAEAAGLVQLVDYETYIEDSLKASDAAAPLEPDNPEHLRQVGKFIRHNRDKWAGRERLYVRDVGVIFEREADRMDREQREAEQDAADRKLAIAKFAEVIPAFDPDSEYGMRVVNAAVAILRARKEVGQ